MARALGAECWVRTAERWVSVEESCIRGQELMQRGIKRSILSAGKSRDRVRVRMANGVL